MNRRAFIASLLASTALPMPPDLMQIETQPLAGLALLERQYISVITPAMAGIVRRQGLEFPYRVAQRLPTA